MVGVWHFWRTCSLKNNTNNLLIIIMCHYINQMHISPYLSIWWLNDVLFLWLQNDCFDRLKATHVTLLFTISIIITILCSVCDNIFLWNSFIGTKQLLAVPSTKCLYYEYWNLSSFFKTQSIIYHFESCLRIETQFWIRGKPVETWFNAIPSILLFLISDS